MPDLQPIAPRPPSGEGDAAGRIVLRPMGADDLELGLRLKVSAGWNQTPADWRMLLEAPGARHFVAQYDGTDAGCVTVLPYEDVFSWIGMLLVDPAFSRRGIGRALLLASVDAAVGAARLDATPAGKRLYDTLGFSLEFELTRWTCAAVPEVRATAPPAGVRLRAAGGRDADAVAVYDRAVFGAGRRHILQALLTADARSERLVAEAGGGGLRGYALGRPGSNFNQVGPLIADDEDIAIALLEQALVPSAGQPAVVDADDRHRLFATRLRELGFAPQRPFIRMTRGEPGAFGQPARQFAIAGPELG